MTVGRISQEAVEVQLEVVPKARLTQHSAELLLQAMPRIRLDQQSVEVLRSVATSSGAGGGRGPVLTLYTHD